MTTTTPSAALIPVAPVFTNTERLRSLGSWPATTAWLAKRTSWTCANTRAGGTYADVGITGILRAWSHVCLLLQ